MPLDDPLGHYAGPLCYCTGGYNGYKVAVEEMVVSWLSKCRETYPLLSVWQERSQMCSLRLNIGTSAPGLSFDVLENGDFARASNLDGLDVSYCEYEVLLISD